LQYLSHIGLERHLQRKQPVKGDVADGTKCAKTNPRWRTAAILKKLKRSANSTQAISGPISTKFGLHVDIGHTRDIVIQYSTFGKIQDNGARHLGFKFSAISPSPKQIFVPKVVSL